MTSLQVFDNGRWHHNENILCSLYWKVDLERICRDFISQIIQLWWPLWRQSRTLTCGSDFVEVINIVSCHIPVRIQHLPKYPIIVKYTQIWNTPWIVSLIETLHFLKHCQIYSNLHIFESRVWSCRIAKSVYILFYQLSIVFRLGSTGQFLWCRKYSYIQLISPCLMKIMDCFVILLVD